MSTFYQRVALLVIGSALTYYVGIALVEKTAMLEGSQERCDNSVKTLIERRIQHPLILNQHEEQVCSSMMQKVHECESSFDDIVGHDKVKQVIMSTIIAPLQNTNYYSRCSLLAPPNGVLLYGPPGTGKTTIARCIASSLGGSFINVDPSCIENKLYGESLKMLKAVFTLAHKIKPCVLFVDEIDGIFGMRTCADQSHTQSLKTLFLSQMDGFIEKDPSVVVVAATNKRESLDAALLRRLSVSLHIGLPCVEDLEKMFLKHLGQFGYTNAKQFALQCIGRSGSHVLEVCKQAAHCAAIDSDGDTFVVKDCHVEEAMKRLS